MGFGVHPLDFPFGNGNLFVQKFGVSILRVHVGNHIIGLHKPNIRIYADYIALLVSHHFIGLDVKPKLAAQFTEALHSGTGHAMGIVLTDGRPVFGVHQEHPGHVNEAEPLIVHADVCPIYIEDINGIFRHPDFPENLVKGVFCHTQEVGVLFHEKGFIYIGEALLIHTVQHMVVEVIVGLVALLGQRKENFHRLFGAGNSLFHGVNDVLFANRQSQVKMLAAAGSADTAVKLRNEKPVDVQLVIFHHQLAGHAPFLGRANRAEFMQGGIKLKTTPHKAG